MDAQSTRDPPYPSTVDEYRRWNLHAVITLECISADEIHNLLHPPQITERPYHPHPHTHRPRYTPLLNLLPSGNVQITMYITGLLSRNIAILSDCHNPSTPRWAIKFFRDTPESISHQRHERNAYNRLQSLQGAEIPFFYGSWQIHGRVPGSCSALLFELIVPGITVAQLRCRLAKETAGWKRRDIRRRLLELHSSGTRVVDRISEWEVMHWSGDAEHLLVAGEKEWCEDLVFVNLEGAHVWPFGVLIKRQVTSWLWAYHGAFMPEYDMESRNDQWV